MSDQGRVGLWAVALALAGLALLWVPVLSLHLTPALFAALITYGGTRAIAALLARRWPQLRHAQAWSLGLVVAATALVGSIAIERAAEAAAEGGGLRRPDSADGYGARATAGHSAGLAGAAPAGVAVGHA